MHSDSIFIQGSSHEVCEDYIIKGKAFDGTHFVILSDGCSSSPMTDIGSRLLVLEAAKIISTFGWDTPINSIFHTVIMNARALTDSYGISSYCLDTTLIILMANEEEGAFNITGMGDGGFVYKQRNEVKVRFVDFVDNYPIYPSYLIATELFNIPDTNHKIVTTSNIPSESYSQSETSWDLKPSIQFSGPLSTIDYVGIFSDGVSSFTNGQNSTPIPEVVNSLVSIKTWKGEFVKRRTKSYIKKMKAEGFTHYDDLSYGVIYTGD